MDLLQSFLATVWYSVKNIALDNHPQMRKILWKSRFPEEKFHHTAEEKKNEFGPTEMGKRNSLTLPTSLHPRQHSKGPGKIFLNLWFILWGKGEHVSEHWLPQLCRTLKKGFISLWPSQSTESWDTKLRHGRGRYDSKSAVKGHRSY